MKQKLAERAFGTVAIRNERFCLVSTLPLTYMVRWPPCEYGPWMDKGLQVDSYSVRCMLCSGVLQSWSAGCPGGDER